MLCAALQSRSATTKPPSSSSPSTTSSAGGLKRWRCEEEDEEETSGTSIPEEKLFHLVFGHAIEEGLSAKASLQAPDDMVKEWIERVRDKKGYCGPEAESLDCAAVILPFQLKVQTLCVLEIGITKALCPGG